MQIKTVNSDSEQSSKCMTKYSNSLKYKYCGFHDVKKCIIRATFDYFTEKYEVFIIKALII